MKKFKKTLAAFLAGIMMLPLCPCALAAEGETGPAPERVREYGGQFTDVNDTSWYAENVKSVYEFGLMDGSTDTTFNPRGNMTIAQTIKVAVRLYELYNGLESDFSTEGTWYRPYVDYAIEKGIYDPNISTDYSEEVSREVFALLISNAVPDWALPGINEIPDNIIPNLPFNYMEDALTALDAAGVDVGTDSAMVMYSFLEEMCVPGWFEYTEARYSAVYRLYRAGVLTGSDKYGTFNPKSEILRSEAAAIISRTVEPALRKTFTLERRPVSIVPVDELADLKSIKKRMTDAELQAAYDEALKIVTPLANLPCETQLCGIAVALRRLTEKYVEYSMEEKHYNDPYGFFVLHVASCAGATRAVGLCLNMLGLPYEHVNENQYCHQWARVDLPVDHIPIDMCWICDAFGLYVGPEPAPYFHPLMGEG